MADSPISFLPIEESPADGDFLVGDFGSPPRTKRVAISSLLAVTAGEAGSDTAETSLALSARTLTYIKTDGTLAKADATAEGKEAVSFVQDSYAIGATATHYFAGNVITGFSGLTPGADYFMSTTPGVITATPPSTDGNVVLKVGTALSATEFLFYPGLPVTFSSSTAFIYATVAQLAASGGAAIVGNTPAGSISGTTVQAALNQLDAHRINVANYRPHFMNRWLLSLAAVRNSSQSPSIAFIGDSTTMGYNASSEGYTNGRIYSYPTCLRRLFNEAGVPAQADSFFGDGNATGSYSLYDPRVTIGASITHAGGTSLGGHYFTMPLGSGILNFAPGNNNTFDKIDIYALHYPGGGTFTVNVGGATLETIDTNATRAVVKTTVTCADTSTQVNIQNASGSVIFVGMNVYSSTAKGVAILNMGWSGSTSDSWGRTTYAEDPANSLSVVNPEAAVICLGINDWVTAVTPAVFSANLQSLIDSLQPYTTCYLVVPIPSDTTSVPLATQKLYRDKIVALAYANNCPVIDLIERRESYETGSAYNLYADSYHGSTFGNFDVASIVADLLLRP